MDMVTRGDAALARVGSWIPHSGRQRSRGTRFPPSLPPHLCPHGLVRSAVASSTVRGMCATQCSQAGCCRLRGRSGFRVPEPFPPSHSSAFVPTPLCSRQHSLRSCRTECSSGGYRGARQAARRDPKKRGRARSGCLSAGCGGQRVGSSMQSAGAASQAEAQPTVPVHPANRRQLHPNASCCSCPLCCDASHCKPAFVCLLLQWCMHASMQAHARGQVLSRMQRRHARVP